MLKKMKLKKKIKKGSICLYDVDFYNTVFVQAPRIGSAYNWIKTSRNNKNESGFRWMKEPK